MSGEVRTYVRYNRTGHVGGKVVEALHEEKLKKYSALGCPIGIKNKRYSIFPSFNSRYPIYFGTKGDDEDLNPPTIYLAYDTSFALWKTFLKQQCGLPEMIQKIWLTFIANIAYDRYFRSGNLWHAMHGLPDVITTMSSTCLVEKQTKLVLDGLLKRLD